MYTKIISILLSAVINIVGLFIDDELEKNDKDPDNFPLSDDYDKFAFCQSCLQSIKDVVNGKMSFDDYYAIKQMEA